MQFDVLSFDGYSRAGGIASCNEGLTQALVELGFETHLWFVGDPSLPGHESHGQLHLYRWCQWINHNHPGSVYDGERGKESDFAASLPCYRLDEVLRPQLQGRHAVVLAEEWHTANAVLHLDRLLRQEGLRERSNERISAHGAARSTVNVGGKQA